MRFMLFVLMLEWQVPIASASVRSIECERLDMGWQKKLPVHKRYLLRGNDRQSQ